VDSKGCSRVERHGTAGRARAFQALRAPGTLNAGRAAKARRARRRVLRLRAAELLVLAGLLSLRSRRAAGSRVGSGSLLVRVMREGARAAPGPACASRHVGGCHGFRPGEVRDRFRRLRQAHYDRSLRVFSRVTLVCTLVACKATKQRRTANRKFATALRPRSSRPITRGSRRAWSRP